MLKDVWAIFQHLFCMFPFMQCHRDLMFWVGKRKKVVKKFGHFDLYLEHMRVW